MPRTTNFTTGGIYPLLPPLCNHGIMLAGEAGMSSCLGVYVFRLVVGVGAYALATAHHLAASCRALGPLSSIATYDSALIRII